jgi:hypothetical protein
MLPENIDMSKELNTEVFTGINYVADMVLSKMYQGSNSRGTDSSSTICILVIFFVLVISIFGLIVLYLIYQKPTGCIPCKELSNQQPIVNQYYANIPNMCSYPVQQCYRDHRSCSPQVHQYYDDRRLSF